MCPKWVEDDDGVWINLDLCRRIEPWQRKVAAGISGPAGKERFWRVELANDRLAVVSHYSLDPYSLSRQLVPAEPGAVAVIVGVDLSPDDLDGRPTADHLYCEHVTLVAWAVSLFEESPSAKPILSREVVPAEDVFVQQPDGAWLGVSFETRHESFDDAKQSVLGAMQDLWDRKHPDAATPAA